MNIFSYPNYPDILTAEETSEILGISKTVCLKLLKSGEIKAFKINNSKVWKVPKPAIIEYTKKKIHIS